MSTTITSSSITGQTVAVVGGGRISALLHIAQSGQGFPSVRVAILLECLKQRLLSSVLLVKNRGTRNLLGGGQIPAVQIGSRGLETARVVIRIQPGSLESAGRPFPWFQMARVKKKGLFWSTRRDQAIRTLVFSPQFQSGKAKDSTPRAMWSPLPRRGEAF